MGIILGDSNSTFIELDGFKNLAEPGSRTKDVLSRLKGLDGGDILIIGVGVNDSAVITDTLSGNRIEPNLDEFIAYFQKLLKVSKDKFSRIIVLGLISSTEEKVRLENAEIQYLNKAIEEFNEAIKRLCLENKIEFVDLLPYFLGKEKELLIDHIHPNKKGQDTVLDKLKDELSLTSRT